MATLSTAEKALVQNVINYLAGNYEKPVDDRVADTLGGLHAKFGFDSEIVFLEGMRDAPTSTLLKALLAVAA